MKRRKPNVLASKCLSDDEQAELERTLHKYSDAAFRDTTLLWTLKHTGARASEALAITKDDLIPSTKSVCLIGLKGSNDREIPLPSWLYQRLAKLPPDEQGRLFSISYIRLYQIWLLYRPINKKLHSLRHTCAINLYKKTLDIQLVRKWLGHRSILNTMVYAENSYTQSEMRRAVEA